MEINNSEIRRPIRFYGQFDPPVDRFIFERYFPDLQTKGVFVECGAFDGVMDSSCKFFEESMGWTGLNLEPVPVLFSLLESHRPQSRNIRMALSDRTGTAVFSHARHPEHGELFGNGSLDHAPVHKSDLEGAGCSFDEFKVSTITWKDLVDREGLKIVDLLVLDVEGHELAVLQGMKGCDVLPSVMCIEFGHLGIDRVRSAMRDLGYDYDVQSAGNAYFVRRDLLSLFALRRTAAGAPMSASSGASLPSSGVPIDIVHFAGFDTIEVRVIGGVACAGVMLKGDAASQYTLPRLKTGDDRVFDGLDIYLASTLPCDVTLVVENWSGGAVVDRASRVCSIGPGRDVVSMVFPVRGYGPDVTPVMFLSFTGGGEVMLMQVLPRRHFPG